MSDIIAASGTYDGTSYRLRVVTDGEIIAHNSDTSKYIHTTISGIGTKDFYNSACCVTRLNGRSTVTATLICTATYWWAWEYYDISSQTWNIMQGGYNSNISQNGLYARTWDAGYTDRYYYYNANSFGGSQNFSLSSDILTVFTNLDDYNNYIQTVAPPTYNWTSVPAIAGNNGQFAMNLSQISDSLIGDWQSVQDSYDSIGLTMPEQSRLYNMLANLADNDEQIVAYCGDNYMTLTRTTVISQSNEMQIKGTLKLYLKTGIMVYSKEIYGYYTNNQNMIINEYLGFIIDEEQQVANLDTIKYTFDETPAGQNIYRWNLYGDTSDTDLFEIYTWLQGSEFPEEINPYDQGSEDNGGVDGVVTPQDTLTPNGLPTVDGLATGMFTVWLPTDTDIVHISSFLWSSNVIDNIIKYFNSVSECILGLYILPYVPDSGISSKKFKIGNMEDSEYSNVNYLTSRYRSIDMGSFDVKAVWDAYLDFAPYSKLEVFLPYCGIHQLDIDELMCPAKKNGYISEKTGSTLTCEYRIDLLTGGVVVYLKMNGEVRYQFSGKMGSSLPVTGNNYSLMVQTLIQGISGLASTVVSHAISAPYAQNPVMPTPPPAGSSKGAIKQFNKDMETYNNQMENRANKMGHSAGVATGAAVSGTIQSMKPDIIRCGNISGDLSLLGYDRPYLIKTRINKPKLVGQQKFTGLPSYKGGKVGDFSGYTECIKVHLENLPCTGSEQEEIERLLQSGVIINTDGSPTPDVTPSVSGDLVIVLIQNNSEVNVIGKKWTTTLKVEGKLIYDNSVSDPVILLNGNYMGYNYCYVPFFNRYYYINDYVVRRQDLEEIHLTVDVLQSFKGVIGESGILNCDCIVSRNESNPNYYINDGVFYTEQREVVTYHCFKKDGEIKKFNTQQLYLITAGS